MSRDVVDVVVEVEAALDDRHVAGVGPVGDVDVEVLQEGLHRAAQQGGVVARTAAPRSAAAASPAARRRGADRPARGRTGAASPRAIARPPPGAPAPRRPLIVTWSMPQAGGHSGGSGWRAGRPRRRGCGPDRESAGRVERRAPEVPRRLAPPAAAASRLVGGFVEGVEHQPPLCGAKQVKMDGGGRQVQHRSACAVAGFKSL